MRHLPVITHRLRHLPAPVQASRHASRRLLLAGSRGVADDVVGSRDFVDGGRHSDGLLRHSDVVRHVTCEEKGVLCGDWHHHWFDSPGCVNRHHRSAVYRSPAFPGTELPCHRISFVFS